MSRGSATLPPITTGPSGRISGAAGDAIDDEEIISPKALAFEVPPAGAASTDGAESGAEVSDRCAVSGCSTTAPLMIDAVLLTGGLMVEFVFVAEPEEFDAPELTVTAGAPDEIALATGPLIAGPEAEFCKAFCSALTSCDCGVDCSRADEFTLALPPLDWERK